MEFKRESAALLLGGNMGDTAEIFRQARQLLARQVEVTRASAIYRTKAWGMPEGTPDFLNQALLISTELSPGSLLSLSNKIESELGRSPRPSAEGYQSRPLDIDLLYYGNKIIDGQDLTLPHPRMHLRNFTLVPLQEVAPQWRHPQLEKTVSQLLLDCPDTLKVQPV